MPHPTDPSRTRAPLAAALDALVAHAREHGLEREHPVLVLAARADAADCPPETIDIETLGSALGAVEELFKALDLNDHHAPGGVAERCESVEDLLTEAMAVRLAGAREAA